MKVIKEFLNYSKNIDANNYANQVHLKGELILNQILDEKNKIRYIMCINRLNKKREGETEFNELFNYENIKLVEKIDLDPVLQDMNLLFYENFN